MKTYADKASSELKAGVEESLTGNYADMYIQGMKGEGKSHLITTVVITCCSIIRVLYIPDCYQPAQNKMAHLKSAMDLAFHDLQDFKARIALAGSLQELERICNDFGGEIIFIFDQWNSLATENNGRRNDDVKTPNLSRSAKHSSA